MSGAEKSAGGYDMAVMENREYKLEALAEELAGHSGANAFPAP